MIFASGDEPEEEMLERQLTSFFLIEQLSTLVTTQEMAAVPPKRTRFGFALIETVGQFELGGADAEHRPTQEYVPEFVCPQEFALDVQATP